MQTNSKFWRDSLNAVPIIFLLIAGLLLACIQFEKRFPNLALLTQFSSLSFVFFGTLGICIAILHSKRPKYFGDKYVVIKAFLTPSLPQKAQENSLFGVTLNYLGFFIVGLVPAILSCWLVHFLGAIGAWVVLAIGVFLVFLCLRGDKNIVFGLFLLCALPVFLYYQGEYYPSAFYASFISSLVAHIGDVLNY